MKNSLNLAPIDPAILAVVQLLQPVRAQEVYEFSFKTEIHNVLDQEQLIERLKQLAKAKLLWRTREDIFGVMPRGAKLAAFSMPPEERDKFRLLTLNHRFRK